MDGIILLKSSYMTNETQKSIQNKLEKAINMNSYEFKDILSSLEVNYEQWGQDDDNGNGDEDVY